MNIVVLHLLNNDYIICDLEMLDEEPCYYLKHAFKIVETPTGDLTFFKYPRYTGDEGCLLHTDKIITMADPEPKIAQKYIEVTGE